MKFLEELPGDASFWAEYREAIVPTVQRIWRGSFKAGATIAEAAAPFRVHLAFKDLDIEAINSAADDYIEAHTDPWWDQLKASQEKILREAIHKARSDGLQPKDVAKLIESQFGPTRALRIATTEITSLLGRGAHTQYKLEGYISWEWQTSNDERVCPICRPRHGEEFPITTEFDAAHVNCRCWPVPGALAAQEPTSFADQQAVAKQMLDAGGTAASPTAIAKAMQEKFPDGDWTALKITHMKQRMGLTAKTPRKPKAPPVPDVVITARKVAGTPELTKSREFLLDGKGTISAHSPSAVKAKIAKDLAGKLKGDPDWDAYAQRRAGSATAWTKDAGSNASSELVQKWAGTSGDKDSLALAMQKAAHQEFGLRDSAYSAMWDHLPKDMQTKVDAILARDGVALKKFLRAQYDHTQAQLKAAGITEVAVYRGQAVPPIDKAPQWAKDAFGHPTTGILQPGTADLPVALRPMSSFAPDLSTAKRFSSMLAEGTVGGTVIFEAIVPASRIIGTSLTGYGCINEWEYVVLDTPGTMVTSYRPR